MPIRLNVTRVYVTRRPQGLKSLVRNPNCRDDGGVIRNTLIMIMTEILYFRKKPRFGFSYNIIFCHFCFINIVYWFGIMGTSTKVVLICFGALCLTMLILIDNNSKLPETQTRKCSNFFFHNANKSKTHVNRQKSKCGHFNILEYSQNNNWGGLK